MSLVTTSLHVGLVDSSYDRRENYLMCVYIVASASAHQLSLHRTGPPAIHLPCALR